MAFTSHADAPFDVCFENLLNAQRKPRRLPFQTDPALTHSFRRCGYGSNTAY